jgi:type II secretory pathway pseudopilin PulG
MGIIFGIVALISAITSTAMQITTANRQAKSQAEVAEANLEQQLEQEQERQRQINKKSQAEKANLRRQAMREQAKVRVSAGEAGVFGSVSSLRQDIDAWQNYGYDVSMVEQNRQNNIEQSVYNQEAYITQAEGLGAQANASYTGPAATLGSIALAGTVGAASGYAAGSNLKSSSIKDKPKLGIEG